MKADGSIIIDTKILDDGMDKGFKLIKDEMGSVATTAKKVGHQIEQSFSSVKLTKPIEEATAAVRKLESEFNKIDLDYKNQLSISEKMEAELAEVKRIIANAEAEYTAPEIFMDAYDKEKDLSAAVEKQKSIVDSLEKKWTSVNSALEASQKRLTGVINKEIEKQAAAEEKAAQKAIKAAEKEAAAKHRAAEKQFRDLAKPARIFGSRLREIVSGALVFNVISAGLRSVTSYFGSALEANTEYSKSLSSLRGSLMTAFQPIYEFVLPAITTLVNWLNTAAQVIGSFFAALTGKSYSQMQKNAKALNKQAEAIGGVGDAAEEAAKQLAGFDEINRLESIKNAVSGGGVAGGNSPIFEALDIPSEWEKAIESLSLRIKDIFFEWDDLNAEIIAEKLITALGIISGGLIGFALGGPAGAFIGMTIGAGIGVAISSIIFDGDGKLSGEELLSALTTALMSITGAIVGFAVGGPAGAAIGMTLVAGLSVKLSSIMFDGDGNLSANEIIKSLVTGLSILAGTIIGFAVGGPAGAAVGATVGLALGFTIQAIDFEGVGNAIKEMLASVRDYFSTTFSDGFLNGMGILLSDAISWMSEMFWDFVDNLIRNWNSIWGNINSYHTTGTIPAASYALPSSLAAYSATPDVPHLAKGAVIPPNAPFYAVLGDQHSGTNVEAPLSTIQEAVRMEIGSQLQTTNELLQRILEKETDVLLDGDKVGRSVSNYQRRMAREKGY